jgi:tetratricopeptide (TPR) repeat protein
MQDKYVIRILFAVVIVATIITYWKHFDNEFQFDDFHTIVENPAVKKLSNIPSYYVDPSTTSSLPTHYSYRPGLTTLNAIDYWIYEKLSNAFPESNIPMQKPFHVSIFIAFILMGICNFFLFLLIFDKIIRSRWNKYIALFATAWFYLHTANAETVNYIIQRAELYSTLFLVFGFVIFIKYPEKRKFGYYIIPLIVGMLVKEPVIIFVPLAFFYLLLFESDFEWKKTKDLFVWKHVKIYFRLIYRLIPIILISVGFLYLSLKHFRPESWSGSNFHWFDYFKTQPFVILHYFITFFLPVNLSVDTDWGLIQNILDTRTIVGSIFIIVALVTSIVITKHKKLRPVAFGIWWFFLALIPTSTIIPLAEVMNDHRIFFPFIGLFMAVSWYLGVLLIKYQKKIVSGFNIKNSIVLGVFLLLLFYALGTAKRNEIWDNSESVWYDVSKKSPKNGRGLMNYGLALMRKGEHELALDYYNKALQYSPTYPYLQINMALCKTTLGKPGEEIEEHYKKAMQFGPNYYGGYHYYGNWLNKNGRTNEAIQMLTKAISLAPNVIYSRVILMEIYFKQQDWEKLNLLATETVNKFPDNETARWYFDESNKNVSGEKDSGYYINLGLTYYNSGEYETAIETWKKVTETEPDNKFAYNNIGSAYNALKKYKEAVVFLEKALRLIPVLSWQRIT